MDANRARLNLTVHRKLQAMFNYFVILKKSVFQQARAGIIRILNMFEQRDDKNCVCI
jgi:hypothetical protein